MLESMYQLLHILAHSLPFLKAGVLEAAFVLVHNMIGTGCGSGWCTYLERATPVCSWEGTFRGLNPGLPSPQWCTDDLDAFMLRRLWLLVGNHIVYGIQQTTIFSLYSIAALWQCPQTLIQVNDCKFSPMPFLSQPFYFLTRFTIGTTCSGWVVRGVGSRAFRRTQQWQPGGGGT